MSTKSSLTTLPNYHGKPDTSEESYLNCVLYSLVKIDCVKILEISERPTFIAFPNQPGKVGFLGFVFTQLQSSFKTRSLV